METVISSKCDGLHSLPCGKWLILIRRGNKLWQPKCHRMGMSIHACMWSSSCNSICLSAQWRKHAGPAAVHTGFLACMHKRSSVSASITRPNRTSRTGACAAASDTLSLFRMQDVKELRRTSTAHA